MSADGLHCRVTQQSDCSIQETHDSPRHTGVIGYVTGCEGSHGIIFIVICMYLVLDWIDQIDVVLAAKDAIAQVGGEIVGVSVVVATSDRVLQELKREQVLFSCGWTPHGAQLAICEDPQKANCVCDLSERPNSRKRKHSADFYDEHSLPVLTYHTAHYQVCYSSELLCPKSALISSILYFVNRQIIPAKIVV